MKTPFQVHCWHTCIKADSGENAEFFYSRKNGAVLNAVFQVSYILEELFLH